MADSGYMTRSKDFTPQIQHDVENRNFFINLGTTKAFLSYNKFDNLLVLEHTEVPAKYAGKGLGKLLAKVRLNVVILVLLQLFIHTFFFSIM